MRPSTSSAASSRRTSSGHGALSIPGIGFRRAVHHLGGTIPARPYLGLSDTDERVIQDLTEDWLRKKMAKMRP